MLANTGITAPLLDDRKDDHESGFPFSSSAAPSFDDLLVLLPPMQQCDILKRQYFEVFSPVGNVIEVEGLADIQPSCFTSFMTLPSMHSILNGLQDHQVSHYHG